MRCKFRNFVILLVVLLPGVNSLQGGDWPMYRADAARTGYSSDPLPDNLELHWVYRNLTAPIPAWPDSSRITFDFAYQPIIVGNTVVFGSSAQDKVVAIDTDSGELRWTFFTGGPVRFAPAVWEDRVFVASDDGFLYCLAAKDGAVLWKRRGGPAGSMLLGNGRMVSRWPARGGPVVADGVVYFAAGIWPSEGIFLYALDAKTGEVVWLNDASGGITMPQPHGGAVAESGVSAEGYLVVSGDRLLVPTGRAVPAVFDLHWWWSSCCARFAAAANPSPRRTGGPA